MMRLTIEQLRAGVVAGAVLLLVIVGSLLFYANRRAHQALRDLPSRLGIDIQKQTNGVTWSQTVGGRIVFTGHAAKATQRKNGEALLEDAGFVLYGRADGRADRIYGKSFHYDQATGVVRALGVVQLDLQATAPVGAADRLAFASGAPIRQGTRAGDAGEPIHVTTSDLVYVQRSGIATTPAPLHFEYGDVVGEARGASYNARTGFTTFDSQVQVRGQQGGRAFHLTADYAELDRADDGLSLRAARLESEPGGTAQKSVTAARMVVHLAAAGGVDRIDGTGGVEISDGEGIARAPTADLTIAAGNRPQRLQMRGGVQFSRPAGSSGAEELSGTSAEAFGNFDANGTLATLDLLRDVRVVSESSKDASTRRLTGEHVLLELAGASTAPRWVRQITAHGSATLQTDTPGAAAKQDSLAADQLEATLQMDASGHTQLESVNGDGHVLLRRTSGAGVETSRAASIVARFAALPQNRGAPPETQLLSAVERGGVVLDRTGNDAAGTPKPLHATALDASYDGTTRRETLLGDAIVSEPGRTLRADQVVMSGQTGDAEASGGVQVTLKGTEPPAGSATAPDPVHAVATRAVFNRRDDALTLFGSPAQDARLWKGASQVESPVIVLHQHEGTMDASGEPRSTDAGVVHTVLAQETQQPSAHGISVVRVQSASVHYSDKDRRAEFLGGVVLRSSAGVVRSQKAIATMAAAAGGAHPAPPVRAPASAMLAGALERVVADGGVAIEQPGRVATGEQVVYTATDGMFVLTGTPSKSPRVDDQATGSVTGAVLRFHTGDNSVVVEGSAPSGKSRRVHTETRLKQ